jgi:hypothetical protein
MRADTIVFTESGIQAFSPEVKAAKTPAKKPAQEKTEKSNE